MCVPAGGQEEAGDVACEGARGDGDKVDQHCSLTVDLGLHCTWHLVHGSRIALLEVVSMPRAIYVWLLLPIKSVCEEQMSCV